MKWRCAIESETSTGVEGSRFASLGFGSEKKRHFVDHQQNEGSSIKTFTMLCYRWEISVEESWKIAKITSILQKDRELRENRREGLKDNVFQNTSIHLWIKQDLLGKARPSPRGVNNGRGVGGIGGGSVERISEEWRAVWRCFKRVSHDSPLPSGFLTLCCCSSNSPIFLSLLAV